MGPVMTELTFTQYIKVQRVDALVRANKMFRTSELLQGLPGEMGEGIETSGVRDRMDNDIKVRRHVSPGLLSCYLGSRSQPYE